MIRHLALALLLAGAAHGAAAVTVPSTAAGRLETRRDFNGKTTTIHYDHRGPRVGPRWTGRPEAERAGSERVNLNRLRFRIPDPSFGAPTIGFTYWPSGQRKTMSDASGVTSYFYDERDRLQQKVTPQGTLNYGWDDQGNLTGISSGTGSVPAGTLGTALEYRYDDLNRLEYVIDVNTGTTSYVYDDVGNLDTVNTPNAVSHVYRYDALNRLGTLTVANLAGTIVQHTYTKAATGHRTAHGEQWAPLSSAGVPSAPNTPAYTRSVSYGYDSLWRLRRESISATAAPALNVASGQIDYDLDAVGNRRSRTSSVPGIINQSFTYDANDRLQSDTPDHNGNTLSGTVSATGGGAPTKTVNGTFTYDDRLATAQTTVANAPASVSYVYDGDGNKVSQTVNSVVTTYLVDTLNPTGYAQVLEERTNGTLTRTYVWGHALIAQVFQGNGGSLVKTFYAYDGHGNVCLLTDESGSVTDRYHYEAFGALIGTEGATSNAHLYCGERFESAIGQYYLRARTMNPLTGRFWSMDTFEGGPRAPALLQKYTYAGGGPVNSSDPSGHLLVDVVISAKEMAQAAAFHAGAALIRYQIASSYAVYAISAATLLTSFAAIAVIDFVSNPLGVAVPDQNAEPLQEYKVQYFGVHGACANYAEVLGTKLGRHRVAYIAYRLRPLGNNGQYVQGQFDSPYGSIGARFGMLMALGGNVATDGFHMGVIYRQRVYDNNILGLTIEDWQLNYYVYRQPDSRTEYTLGEADSLGFGQLQIFQGTPPAGKSDPRWK